MGISIWLVPPPTVASVLTQVMRSPIDESLIRDDNPRTSYPSFQPHITLVASVPFPVPSTIISNVLSMTKSPVELQYEKVEIGDHYYRSVYIAMQLSDDLVDLHGRMHLNLGLQPRTPEYPHMSLSYINDEDAGDREREKYYERLKSGLPELIRVAEDDSIEINHGVGGDEKWESEFSCTQVWVVDCNGPVEGWTVLEEISIG